ncbi:MAG: adenylate kinase [Candidatus Woesearchaeota archaeon]
MKLLIIGPQGSGKGTQAKKIAEHYELKHISTGDIFRENIKNETELGKLAKTYIDSGKLVPDEVTNDIVADKLKTEQKFILDGFPRNLKQAQFLDNCVEIDYVIVINLTDDEVMKRLTGRRTCKECGEIYHINFKPSKIENKCDHDDGDLYQRDDDKPEAIAKRLDIYYNETSPIIDHYKDKVVEVDGSLSIEEVWDLIKQKMG